MKRLLVSALALASVAAAAAPAAAQTWVSINQRQATLDHRIDQGIKNGSLTAGEAANLRVQFRSIANLEAAYRRSNGVFTQAEKADLDKRMDALAARVTAARSNWRTINQRQAELDRRIDVGVRNGSLTAKEAVSLRAEFQQVARMEASFRASHGVLTAAEKADLDRRMDVLTHKIRTERSDAQQH